MTKEEERIKRREYNQRYIKKHPEARRSTTKRYKEKVKPQMEKHRLENYEEYILVNVRAKAKKHSLEFNLELSDIIIPEVCPYLKITLTKLVGVGRRDTSPSIDRIDPTKGYIKGNIEIISDKANRMKNNASVDELITFSKYCLMRFE